jgi:transposase
MPKAISQFKLNSVLSGLDAGHSITRIVADTHLARSSIYRIRTEHHPDLAKSVGGRPPKLSPANVRYAVRTVTHSNTVSASQAAQQLCNLTGQSIHPSTVRRALRKAGLKAVKKPKKPQLTYAQQQVRKAFALAHKDWTVEDWKRVLWSDETKINRLGSDGLKWAWARKGDPLSNRLIRETRNFGGGSLMFWGCMGWNGTGLGCKLEGTMTKFVYLDILRDELMGTLEHFGWEPADVLFQQDNASSHKSKVCIKWFEDQGFELLEWPADSPDLNPIENLWSELKRRLGCYETPPSGVLELWERVQEEWNQIEPEYCQKLIESMPTRMAEVLRNKGGPIDY